MSLILQEFGLPLDICLIIEKINSKENLKLVLDELVDKVNFKKASTYKMHEWYFIQIISFIRGINYKIPEFNDNITHYIFNEIKNDDNLTNYYHHLLYKDHMNMLLYQKRIYNIYYNPN
ncbi:MAG: hypothetical protein CMI31_12940 [Opitutae bacterium]|nr:hypothetical protein [Opitutae bacterium]|tara:strand:+ start:5817 stop:6173 length:357 start_codon:yes stop_codon:yes gene_type:complete